MTGEQSLSEREIFRQAVQLPENQRSAFLENACGDNAELRLDIESLLQAHDLSGSFMERPALAARFESDCLAEDSPHMSEEPGTIIGPYKLLQQIGEGGMGVVFMAEQSVPIQRTVALKIIKPGMDTRQVIARFEAERQALAMMDHPNIAKVLDAGQTETGRPYFVMELVKGLPITKYCDQKQLSLRQRLELFLPVCQAVQHAHQKGIIHRDLKPTNVLVAEYDDHSIPKVIDFGVAKATAQKLTERTMFTEFGQVIGTVEYMSPEQAKFNQLDVDTRSDIYSLGVLLYELFTGSTPFERERLCTAAFDEVLRIIREEEPQKPSTRLNTSDTLPSIAANRQTEPARLSKDVSGELDWIVMKCLEKDRGRRYATASAFADDLNCYLLNQAVAACPPSPSYRLKKLVRRNKAAVFAGFATIAALLIGLVVASIGFIQAHRQAARADREAKAAQTQATRSEQVSQFLKDMLKSVGPSVAQGRDTTMLLEIVDKTASRVSSDLHDQPEVEVELRLTLAEAYSSLQLYNEMEKIARETNRLATLKLGEESIGVADSLIKLGDALLRLHKFDEASAVTNRAVSMTRKLRGASSLQEAEALRILGDILRGDTLLDGELVAFPDDNLRLKRSEDALRGSLSIYEIYDARSSDVAQCYDALALTLLRQRKLADSEAEYRRAMMIRQQSLTDDQNSDLTRSFMWLGYALATSGKLEEGEVYLRKAIPIQRKTQGTGKWYQAVSLAMLGEVLQNGDKLAEAELCLREAIAISRDQMGNNHPYLTNLILNLSCVLFASNQEVEGKLLEDEALALLDTHSDWGPSGSNVLANYIRSLLRIGRLQDAADAAHANLAIRQRKLPDSWRTADAQSLLGECMLRQKRFADAESFLRSGYEGLRSRRKLIPPTIYYPEREALQRLIQLYDATNRADEAAKLKHVAADESPALSKGVQTDEKR